MVMSSSLVEQGLKFIDEINRFGEFNKRLLLKTKADTDPNYGCIPWNRPLREYIGYGVINLDKPPGPTSHEVVAWIKRILKLSKAGHGGTLDPKVTGVLPVALERATKVIGIVVHTMKEYICVMQLHGDVSDEKLREAISLFIGEIYQRPPLRSSVKRSLRKKRIYYIDILEREGRYVLLRIGCEAGTYARKLCRDIGEILGVGAHMRELRRTRAGPFKEDETLVRLHDIAEAYYIWETEGNEKYLRKVILPMEFSVGHLPKVIIRDSAVDAICHGADLAVPGISMLNEGIKVGDMVAVMTLKGELVALGKALMPTEKIIEASKGIAVKTVRVIMKPGTYPKMWGKKKE